MAASVMETQDLVAEVDSAPRGTVEEVLEVVLVMVGLAVRVVLAVTRVVSAATAHGVVAVGAEEEDEVI